MKQLKRKLGEIEDPEEAAKLKADIHIAEVDVDYTKYFPFLEPYISLYPRSGEDGSKEKKTSAAEFLHVPRPAVWKTIEKAREEGEAALERIQNRQPAGDSGAEPREISKEPTPTKKQSSRTKPEPGGKRPKKEDKGKPFQKGKAQEGTKRSRDEGQSGGGDDGGSDSDGGFFDIDED